MRFGGKRLTHKKFQKRAHLLRGGIKGNRDIPFNWEGNQDNKLHEKGSKTGSPGGGGGLRFQKVAMVLGKSMSAYDSGEKRSSEGWALYSCCDEALKAAETSDHHWKF